ncbi:hypothetical protein CHELA40_10127 [Chelatococcus asaccharovorans]|nr:hypothetical protein CHELA40_10127 [Chelatococcus asaccharovorans]
MATLASRKAFTLVKIQTKARMTAGRRTNPRVMTILLRRLWPNVMVCLGASQSRMDKAHGPVRLGVRGPAFRPGLMGEAAAAHTSLRPLLSAGSQRRRWRRPDRRQTHANFIP